MGKWISNAKYVYTYIVNHDYLYRKTYISIKSTHKNSHKDLKSLVYLKLREKKNSIYRVSFWHSRLLICLIRFLMPMVPKKNTIPTKGLTNRHWK